MKNSNKILLVAPSTYGFYDHIVKGFERSGFEVRFYDEHRFLPFSRLLFKLPRKILEVVHQSYFKEILMDNLDVDIVLMVRCEYLKNGTLECYRRLLPKAKFIMYQWDFQANLPNLLSQYKYFDEIYSFDKKDCIKFGFKHKPLFFNSNHIEARNSKKEFLFCFVGTDHSDRYFQIQQFLAKNMPLKEQVLLHLYRPLRSIILSCVKDIAFLIKRDLSIYKTKPLNENETLLAMASSDIILDFTPENQDGLTMRTLEALGLCRKLVTTNSSVKEYDFYSPNNILIISGDNMEVSSEFLDSVYTQVPSEILDKYFVNEWVKEFVPKSE